MLGRKMSRWNLFLPQVWAYDGSLERSGPQATVSRKDAKNKWPGERIRTYVQRTGR